MTLPTTPAEVIALFDTPEKLLRHCFLWIAGRATRTPSMPHAPAPPANGPAAVIRFKVSISDNKAIGYTSGLAGLRGKTKDRVFVRVVHAGAPGGGAAAADELDAYYIPMVQTSDVAANSSHYTLPTAGAPKVAITSKLTGCMFGVGSDAAGALLVSHVQPNIGVANAAPTNSPADVRGSARQTDLSRSLVSGFQNPPDVFRMGPGGDEYDASASIIGKRTGTRWAFYMQKGAYDSNASAHVVKGLSVIG